MPVGLRVGVLAKSSAEAVALRRFAKVAGIYHRTAHRSNVGSHRAGAVVLLDNNFAFARHFICEQCKVFERACVLYSAWEVCRMRFLTAKEVSVLMRIPLARVYELARQNLIPCVRMGRQIRFNEEALREWAARGGTVITGQTQTSAAA
jgi:excisionase family DNA binding protein